MRLHKDKICCRCRIKKDPSSFRVRKEGKYSYLSNNCKECENNIQKDYYKSKKADPEFIKKNRDRAKKYRKDNIEIVNAKDRLRRSTDNAKSRRKEYNKVYNKDQRAIDLHKARNKKYLAKISENISEAYVKRIIWTNNYRKKDGPNSGCALPELISKTKRDIAVKRVLKTIKKLGKNGGE